MDRLKAKQKNMDKQASQILRQQRQLQVRLLPFLS